MAANEHRTPDHLAALDALAKIVILAEAASYLTASATERQAQSELIGIISDIASGTARREA